MPHDMKSIQREIEERVVKLSDEDREYVSTVILAVLRCYAPEPREHDMVLITVNGTNMAIEAVNSTPFVANNILCMAHGALHESVGAGNAGLMQ